MLIQHPLQPLDNWARFRRYLSGSQGSADNILLTSAVVLADAFINFHLQSYYLVSGLPLCSIFSKIQVSPRNQF